MATEIKKTEDQIEAQRQLLKTADLRLSHLETSIIKTKEKIAELNSEKQSMEAQIQERKRVLDQARQELEKLQEVESIARNAFEMAEGTKLEMEKQELWQASVFSANNASADLDKLFASTQKQDVVDSKELQQLNRSIEKQSGLMQMEQKQLFAFSQARSQIHDELGQALFEQHVQVIEEAKMAHMRNADESDEMSANMLDMSTTALQELEPWPELRASYCQHAVVTDPALEILRAYLDFQRLLLEKGYGVQTVLENTLYATTPYRALAELLELNQDDMNDCFYRLTPPLHTQERVKMCNRVLSVYREEKLKG
jgi:hypothetical protein